MGVQLIYRTTEELEKKIDEYFETCQDKVVYAEDGNPAVDKYGNPVVIQNPPTVSGLAIFLGFADRRSLYDYKEREIFSYTIKKAITRIEEYAEQHLYQGKATGAIFWLKNHGWVDKQENDVNVKIKQALVEFVDGQSKSSDTEIIPTVTN